MKDMRRWAIVIVWGMALSGDMWAAMPKSSASGEEVFRLNCGAVGWDYTDPRGDFWLQDEAYTKNNRWGFVNGAVYDEGSPTDTDLVPLYRTQRRGLTNLKYVVDLPNGNYHVTLHFIETVYSAAGKRVFDVALGGTVVLDHLDIFSRVGKSRPFKTTFPVTVTDKKLEVTFPAIYTAATGGYATVSGVEVKAQSVSDDVFLDFLQYKMFPYFLTEAGASTGLVSDKSYGWDDQDFDVASIATTGFGLSVLTVAAERGWITPLQARQRVHTILDFFKTMQQDSARSYHGFWYHYVNWNTGGPAWSREISTVDSALFIMGALQVGEYFRSTDPAIAAKAEDLYKNMEWDWFTKRGGDTPFLSMGWKATPASDATIKAPDRGYFIPYRWDAYNESVFVTLLALGSPTHSVDPGAWVRMRRHGIFSEGGVSEFMHFPPLFGHQYHNLYFNFKDKHDGTSDFWDAAVRATLRDRNQFAKNPLNEPDIWGLTACEVPGGGYEAFGAEPGGKDWGITAPTGPLGSIALTPAESIAAARKMFFQYKHRIWGRHGFVDSFSVSDDSRADNTLGLDNGPIVLAIENYRSGLLWNTFMKNPYVSAALAKAGFMATGEGPRVFSHSEKNGNRAVFAHDQNPATGWESSEDSEQWLTVDFGRPTPIDSVRLTWGPTFAIRFEIQTSDDGTLWDTVAEKTNGEGGSDRLQFPRVTARMVRWVGQERGGIDSATQGYSLLEMHPEAQSVPSTPRVLERLPTQVTWAWDDNSSGETGYRVRRVSDNAVLVDQLPPNTVTWTQNNLIGNTPHQVQVEVYSAEGSLSSEPSDRIYTPASPPADVVLRVVNGNPVLSWNGASNSESTVYRAYRTTDRLVFTQVFSGKSFLTGPLALPSDREVMFRVYGVTDEDERSEMVSLSTRTAVGALDPQKGSPHFESKEPPFTVAFLVAPPVDSDQFVTLEPLDVLPGPPPSPWRLVESCWRAEVVGGEGAPPVAVKPRRVTGPTHMVAKWNNGSTSWDPLDTDGFGGHGGIFAVFYIPTTVAPSTVDTARIYPSPFSPSRSPSLKIDQIPAGAEVKIFSMRGEQIFTLLPADANGFTQWDGRNAAGRSVSPGVYWGVINGNGAKKTFRFAVQ
jgi:hypothetical protein